MHAILRVESELTGMTPCQFAIEESKNGQPFETALWLEMDKTLTEEQKDLVFDHALQEEAKTRRALTDQEIDNSPEEVRSHVLKGRKSYIRHEIDREGTERAHRQEELNAIKFVEELLKKGPSKE